MTYKGRREIKKKQRVYLLIADITGLDVDAIVNAANNSLLGGGGVDGAIHQSAGPGLLAECRQLGGCQTGEAKITGAYDLKADHVIHTVGPVYSGKKEDAKLLRSAYWNSLEVAKKNYVRSIAFPAISTGVYGYPLREATMIAMKTVSDWLQANSDYMLDIIFCAYSQKTYDVYDEIVAEIDFPELIRLSDE